MEKLKVGQKLFLKELDWKKQEKITEVTVTKVGNKYFQISDSNRDKYNNETLKIVTDFGVPQQRCYLSLQDIEDEKEYGQLSDTMRKAFDHWANSKFSLDQLRRIHKIITEGKNETLPV